MRWQWLWVGIVLLAFPGRANAGPVKRALLTPKTATIWVEESCRLEPDGAGAGRCVLKLPPQALLDTLAVEVMRPDGLELVDIARELVRERDEEQLRQLRQEIEALEQQIARKQGARKAKEGILALWRAQAEQGGKSLEETLAFLEASKKTLEEVHAELVDLDRDSEKMRQDLEELRRRWRELSGDQSQHWRITCLLQGEVSVSQVWLRYHYTLRDAGWRPTYRIDARPRQGEIRFSWEAEIWQRSGRDWQEVELSLATLEPPARLQPPALPPWILQPRLEQVYRQKALMGEMAPAADLEAKAERKAKAREEKTGYSIYYLGRHSLATGRVHRVRVATETWAAEFRHLLRPFVAPWAFVRGKVEFDRGRNYPRGEAAVFLDGTFVAKAPFEVRGLEQVFFFGTDPLVTATMTLEDKQTGSRGFISKKKSYLWSWSIHLENGHDYPVQARLEERRQQARDERIVLEVVKVPPLPGAKEDHSPEHWAWEFPLAAGEKRDLPFKVQALAPEDMEVDPGW